MAVEIGSVILEHLIRVDVHEGARIVRHAVPGMNGDLAQVLGRSSVSVSLEGLFYGEQAGRELQQLRDAYLEKKPLDFFADAVGEAYFAQVLITYLNVFQQAGYLDQFHFSCDLVEYVEPPEPVFVDPLDALDSELLGEAIDFVDDVQNAIEEVSGIVDLLANIPSFGDPTTRLPGMLDDFAGATSEGVPALLSIRDLF